jgi:trehalose-6-phosphatase
MSSKKLFALTLHLGNAADLMKKAKSIKQCAISIRKESSLSVGIQRSESNESIVSK